MAFSPHGKSRLGHVAAVSRIVDSRTVLIRHANWSPINGRRGQIEDDVRAVDVSAEQRLERGARLVSRRSRAWARTHWPVQGFIYNRRARQTLRHACACATRLARSQRPSAARTPRLRVRGHDPIGAIIARRNALASARLS